MSTIVTLLSTALASPDVLIAAASVVGGLIGWWAKVRHGDSSLPAGVADLIKQLAAKQALAAAHGSLADLLTHAPAVVPAAAPPALTAEQIAAALAALGIGISQAPAQTPAAH